MKRHSDTNKTIGDVELLDHAIITIECNGFLGEGDINSCVFTFNKVLDEAAKQTCGIVYGAENDKVTVPKRIVWFRPECKTSRDARK